VASFAPFAFRFRDAVVENGVPFVEDVNDPSMGTACSITKLRTTVNAEGKRSSTDDAFLSKKEVQGKRNLTVCVGVVVQRLEIDDDNQVRGVYVEREENSDSTYYIRAKEIVLCSGAVGSPQILLLR